MTYVTYYGAGVERTSSQSRPALSVAAGVCDYRPTSAMTEDGAAELVVGRRKRSHSLVRLVVRVQPLSDPCDSVLCAVSSHVGSIPFVVIPTVAQREQSRFDHDLSPALYRLWAVAPWCT